MFVTQSCLTLCDPMDCSLPGSFVRGIFQARILEWVVISFSRGSSRPRVEPMSLTSLELAGSFFTFTLYLYSLFFTAQPGKSKVRIITKIESSINMKVKVSQLCPTLGDRMDCSLPGSFVRGVLEAAILEWVTIPFSRESS